MDDRTENKEPLSDDAIPVTHLLTASSWVEGKLILLGNVGFTPGGDNHSEQHRLFRLGGRDVAMWTHALITMLARRTTYRPCQRFR